VPRALHRVVEDPGQHPVRVPALGWCGRVVERRGQQRVGEGDRRSGVAERAQQPPDGQRHGEGVDLVAVRLGLVQRDREGPPLRSRQVPG